MEENNIIISCNNVKKYYPIRDGIFNRIKDWKHIVDGLSFKLEQGKTLALVGESGCGKSVLLRLILGLENVTEGEIYFKGKSVYDLSEMQRLTMKSEIGMIFQDTLAALHPRMSIMESLKEPLLLNGMKDRKQMEKVIIDTLECVGMAPDFLNRYPHQLSGGQLQRIAIARALIIDPQVILADEPISALDVSLQAQVINMLIDLQESRNLSILLVAHDLAVVRQIASDIMIMYLGTIVESGKSSDIYKNAKHPYTKVLLKAAPSISKGINNEPFHLDLKVGDTPNPENPPKGCSFCTKCMEATERCLLERPEPKEVSPRHFVSCLYV